MKAWQFLNQLEVYEITFDYDLHAFEVYLGDKSLGTITPSSLEEMQSMIEDLDNGNDPITQGWGDGNGHMCTLEGWED